MNLIANGWSPARGFAWLFAITTLITGGSAVADAERIEVFRSGTEEYHTVRIPSAVVTAQGTVLAFCEGRKNSGSDAGDIDILLRRSSDGGTSWGPVQKIWDDGGNTCGNPCAVVDRETGVIWLLLTWNSGTISESAIKPGFGNDSRLVFVSHSQDNGKTWSEPTEITSKVKDKNWSWYATGPGAGIQVQHGKHRGRLVIPCDCKVWQEDKPALFYSHVIYSDDHGKSWKRGELTPQDKVNECEVVELADGRLLLNMRNYDRRIQARQVAYSDDGGATWYDQRIHEELVEPRCQASIRRHSWPSNGQEGVILFSNPAHGSQRVNMTVRASFDEGETWPRSLLLHPGSSAYSCLVDLPDGSIGCLYEMDSYGRIVFDRFSLKELQSPEASAAAQ